MTERQLNMETNPLSYSGDMATMTFPAFAMGIGAAIQNPWAMHYQAGWRERADDTSLPLWLRVAALAYGRHGRNGHANFGPGEIAAILGTNGTRVSDAIKLAIQHKFLHESSKARCLRPLNVAGGPGSPYEVCRVHGCS